MGLAEVELLRPVEFALRSTGERDFGFIAEEVAEIHPILATYAEDGAVEGVRYRQMTALLAGAVQELAAEKQELTATVETQTVKLDEQAAQLTAQAAELAELRATLAQQQRTLEALAARVDRLQP